MQIKTVNKAIAATGLELVKGNGYFYFVGEGTERLNSTSVYVMRLNDMTIERWIETANGFAQQIAELPPVNLSAFRLFRSNDNA